MLPDSPQDSPSTRAQLHPRLEIHRVPRGERHRRPGPGVAPDPCAAETQREAAEAADLDAPAAGETLRHVLEHHLHRELDVALGERTRDGLARARASGKKLGRPKGSLGVSRLDGREDEIRRFLNLGVPKTSIARITGVSRPTLYNFIATRGLKAGP